MYIRPTQLSDIPRIATIVDTALNEDELNNFLNPNRAKYPLSWRQHVLNIQYSKYYDPKSWHFVCVADGNDGFAPEEEILGTVRWLRRVAKVDAAIDAWTRKLSYNEKFEGWLRSIALQWEDTIRSNPAIDWKRHDAFMSSIMKSTKFAPLKETTHWWLDNLMVAPEYQRKGVGKKLVQEGLQRVREENAERSKQGKVPVPAALVASATGPHLYRHLGFKIVGWEDAAFLDVEAVGGSAMVWDETGHWIKEIPFEGAMRRGIVEAEYTKREDREG